MLSLDFSLFIQIANFLVLLFILNVLFYRPIRRVLKQRNDEMSSLGRLAEQTKAKAAARSKELEESEARVRKEGFREKEGMRNEALEMEKKVYQEATASAGGRIEEARKKTSERVGEIRHQLDKEVGLFSKELAEKILGRRLQ